MVKSSNLGGCTTVESHRQGGFSTFPAKKNIPAPPGLRPPPSRVLRSSTVAFSTVMGGGGGDIEVVDLVVVVAMCGGGGDLRW